MTFNEIFEQISNESGLEYKHCTVEGRIKDICDFYGVDTRGKTLTMALRELLQIKDTSCNLYSFLLTQLMNLVVTKWYDIVIDESPEVVNTADGQLKVVQVMGNCYQAEETNLVPTPERPIPIISKKVKAGDSYVELRSLKETSNLFDLEYGKLLFGEEITTSGNGKITNNGSSVVIENIYAATQLKVSRVYMKANTKYIFKADRSSETIEGMEQGSTASLLGFWKGGVPVRQIGNNASYTPTESGYYELYLYGGVGYKITYTNLMLVEGNEITSTYVPPTVRDYKIVDSKTKTSKIVRNVLVVKGKDITSMNVTNISSSSTTKRWTTAFKIKQTKDTELSNIFNCVGYYKISTEGFGVSANLLGLLIDKEKYTSFEQVKELIKDSEFYLKLATPAEEPITYVETDTSEVGLSWQDTTSPSPGVPSEVYEVTDLVIKTTSANLLDLSKYGYENQVVGDKSFYLENNEIEYGQNYCLSCYVQTTATGRMNITLTYEDDSVENFYGVTTTNAITRTPIKPTKKIKKILLRFQTSDTSTIFKDVMLNTGTDYLSYQPYQESSITHHLAKPLRATKDGSVRDVIDVVNNNIKYRMQKYVVTGNESFMQDYQGNSGYYGRFFNFSTSIANISTPVWCNYLPYVASSWSKGQIGMCTNGTQVHLNFDNKTLGITDDTPVEEKRTAFANYLKQLYASENPLYVVVVVNETAEPLEAELVQKLKQLKTFSPVTYIWVEGLQPIINAQVKLEVYDRTKLKGGG